MRQKVWLFGLAGLIVGGLYSFYHLAIPKLWGVSHYTPLALNTKSPSFAVDETIFYASKTREILDGNWWISDVDIKEYKNTPSPFVGETIPAVLMAFLVKLSGGVGKGFMIADFIFPGVVFFILSLLINQLTSRKYLSMVGALVVMFGYQYFSYFPYLPSIIKLLVKYFQTGAYSHFIRSFHPQISFGLFLGFVIIFFKTLNKHKKKVDIEWWLGWFLGLLIYTHVFYWSFAFVWVGVGLVMALVNKDKKRVKRLGLSLVIGLLLGLVYWLNLYWFSKLPISQDFILNSWFKTGWRLRDIGLIFIMTGLTWFLIKEKVTRQFWLSFFVTSLVVMVGSQVIGLGFDDPVGHWLQRVVYPMTGVFGFSLLVNFLKRDYKWLSLGLVLLLLGYQSRVHFMYFKNQAEVFRIEPERLELFEWLNQNTQKDSVVMTAGLKDNLYLPVYTHNNVFIPRSQLSLASTEETIERFLMTQKLVGKTETELREMFKENHQLKQVKRFDFDNCAGVYLFFRRYIQNDYYNCSVPNEVLDEITDKYKNAVIDLNKYQADYWLTDETFDQGELLWENQKYKLYKL